ncbi:hypothetical protein HDU96_001186, partial [Phlyctochytrium bullatum]
MKRQLSETDKTKRLAKLRKRNVQLDGLHSVLRSSVLGDFLDFKHPQRKLIK